MRTFRIISSTLAVAAATGAARADSLGRPCTDKPESAYLSLDAMKAKVVEQGYEIRSGSIKEACGEFYVLDKAGKRAELFLDPTTGVIVSGGGQNLGEAATAGAKPGEKSAEGGGTGEQSPSGAEVGEKSKSGAELGEAEDKSEDQEKTED